jgi:PAS domain S-box-containing protein
LYALLAAPLAILLRYALMPLIGSGSPYVTLFPATVAVALLAGFGPAILTGILGSITIDYLFIEPLHAITIDIAHFTRMAVVVLTSAFVGYVGDVLRAARTKAEQQALALRESQADLNRAQAVANTGSWRLDVKKNELSWSDEVYRMFGISKGTPLIYESFLAFIHPDDRQFVDTKWKAAMAGEKYDIEHRIVVDGKIKWVRERAELEFDKDGTLLGGFGTVTDITHSKQAEETLKQSELKYRSIISTTMDGFWQIDSQSHLLDINDAACQMLGYSRNEMLSMKVSDIEAIEKTEDVERHIQKMKDLGGDRFETRHRRKDGIIIDVEVSTKFLKDTKDSEQIFAFIRDITDRKKAEEALRQSEQHLSTVFHSSPTGIFITRLSDGLFLDVNEAFLQVIGYSKDEVIGHTSPELNIWINPEDREQMVNILREQGHTENREIKLRHKSGEIVDLLSSTLPLERSREHCVLGAITNITARKQMEEELRKARDELELRVKERTAQLAQQAALLDLANDAILVRDLDSRITFWNQGAEETYGWTKKQALGKAVHILLKTEFPKLLEEIEADVIRQEQWEGELIHTKQDGTQITIASRWVLQRDDNGNPMGILEINRDITPRKKLENIITAERQRLYDVLETLPAYVCLLTPDCRMPFANRVFREWFGYKSDKKCYEFLFNRTKPCENCETYNVLKTNKPHRWEWTGPNGRNYDIYDFPFKDTDGSQLILEMGIDITERKTAEVNLEKHRLHLEEMIKQRTEELTRSNKDLEQFAYVTSHDLQEPLRMIAGYTQLLQQRYKDKLDEDANHFIFYMVDGAVRMQSLINDLLAYSRLNTSSEALAPVNCRDVLDEVLATLQMTIEENGAVIKCGPLPNILADRTQLLQLFQNLIGNAIKFRSDKPPIINITAKPQDKQWLFSVSDNGIGIEPQYLERIFVIFQRLHTRDKYPGTGIGLAICKKIVERHKGQIWAESQPGKGSTFHFII